MKKGELKSIIINLISNFIWEILISMYASFSLAERITNVLTFSLSPYNLNSTFLIFVLFIVIESIIISITIIIKTKSNNKQEELQNDGTIDETKNEIMLKCKCEKIVAEMIFNDRENIQSKIEYNMHVLADSVQEINKQVIWTGNTYKGTKIISSDEPYELIDSDRKQSPYPYKIVFNPPKLRGDSIRFKTETLVVDDKHNMSTIYSFMVKYQTDKLVLRLIVPKNLVEHVTKSAYADLVKDVCIEHPKLIPPEEIGNNIVYNYEIDNPILLHNYFIDWIFTNK